MSDRSDIEGAAPDDGRPAAASSPLTRVFFAIGAAALLLAMASDAAAVAGRHLGLPFLGSIELVQSCVAIAASSAMIGATLGGAHATVHIVLERAPPRVRAGLESLDALLAAVCFAFLAAGSIWLTHDLWGGREQTELLRLPLLPLRMFWSASAVLIAGIYAARTVSALRSGGRS